MMDDKGLMMGLTDAVKLLVTDARKMSDNAITLLQLTELFERRFPIVTPRNPWGQIPKAESND